ncbi:GNAT family N-acetyltransferase [Hyphococcus lacteus]|uniref:GNAT family N-acetyltransferase n=1 Tax=Hyphococcus lacteus TaxID=3143536 RepID=A0ABV3Z5C0_9PROT
MSGWRIWTAKTEDADTLVALEALAFDARSWGEDSVKASFVASGVTVLLGGQISVEAPPLGFALWRDLGEQAEILTIGVAPTARGGGLGEALLDAVIKAARDGGAQKLFLEVDAANSSALALYMRAGFATIGARKQYYRDGGDAAVMALDL